MNHPDIHRYQLNPDDKALRNLFIQYYYMCGYKSDEILGTLWVNNGVQISKRQLWNILAKQDVSRTCKMSDAYDILLAILQVRENGGTNLGYRNVWQRLRLQYGLSVPQRMVNEIMRSLDPEGVADRSRRRLRRRMYESNGPNHVMHIDGYDKLKKYGICVHGAIDGYSRKILWMKACPSNSNPRYVARYYLDTILKMDGVPVIVRGDPGTENCLIRDLQRSLRYYDTDAAARRNCFLYGKSNQRIESMWSTLRGLLSGFWISFFRDLHDSGNLDDSDPAQVECVRYCFLSLIQSQLDATIMYWNQHPIRKQPNRQCPCSKPNLLFNLPEAFGSRDCKRPLMFSAEEIAEVRANSTDDIPERGCSNDFLQLADLVLEESRRVPASPEEALLVYTTLMRVIL